MQKYSTDQQELEVLSNMALGCAEVRAACVAQLRKWVEVLEGNIAESVLVPAMLVALHSPEEQCRHNALVLLDSLAHRLRTELPVYHVLVDHLTRHAQEIEVDHE